MSELTQELNPTGKTGEPRNTPGEARKTLIIEPHPDCLIQAAAVYQKGDRLCLSRPGEGRAHQAGVQNQDEATQKLIIQDHISHQAEHTPQSVELDLGHPKLRDYLWRQIDHAHLAWPDATPLQSAVAKLRQKPFRLPAAEQVWLEQSHGLLFPLLAAWSEPALALKKKIQSVAARDLSVLITGEPGSGREAVAMWIHELSDRRQHPLAVLDCACLDVDRLRSELFGHAKGAFPWATEERPGLLETTACGTLVLLNLGQAGNRLQADIVRLIRSAAYRRVGDYGKHRELKARVISTAEGPVDPALQLALAQAEISFSSPGELQNDIPGMARHLIQRIGEGSHSEDEVQECLGWLEASREQIAGRTWSGGYAELIQTLRERLLDPQGEVGIGCLLPPAQTSLVYSANDHLDGPDEIRPLSEVITEYVERADLARGPLSRKDLAKALGISPNTLYRHLKYS